VKVASVIISFGLIFMVLILPDAFAGESPPRGSGAKEIHRQSMPEGGMRIDSAICSLFRCRSALRRADRAASTPQWIRCTGASARRRRPS